MEQRFMFDQMAKAYDAFRPGYPDALFADLAAETGLSEDDRILELGCGAGQATAGLAALGAPLLALDPGPELIRAARLRIRQAPHVDFKETTFEAWPLQPGAFKLVAAAQAWHWIDPGVRFEKAARSLAPGGVLAIMGNVPMSPPADFLQAVEPLFRRYAPHLWGPPPEAWYLPSGPLPELFPTAQRFGPLIHRVYPYAVVHTPESFEGLHRSFSYYQALPAADRDALIGGMVDHIRGWDGTFRMNYEAHLYMAHRRV